MEIGIVADLYRKTDGINRALKLQISNKTYERAIKHLH